MGVLAVAVTVLSAARIRAEVACPPIFSDHMVLQRDRAVQIWGTAAVGERVTVEFAGQRKSTTAAADGNWRVTLAPLPASSEPRDLVIRAQNRESKIENRKFTDVLVGEVWLCSGQSNMEKQLGPRQGQKPTDNFEEEIRNAQHPQLRLFQVPHHGWSQNAPVAGVGDPGPASPRPATTNRAGRPRRGVDGLRWLPCSPETVASTQFSAAAYYFGREIRRELGVPVGLIHASFGGTMIEAWMPRSAFARDPALRPLLEQRYHAWVEGVQATELFQSMIAPLAPYSLRGFLWYQGEANCMNGDTKNYAGKQRALIRAWREVWHDARAPFYFAQLAPFNYSEWDSFPQKLTPHALPLFWEAQVAALDVPRTGMIVTTDVAGDARDIHPTNKRDVGLRFARLALRETYGRREVVAHGPEFAGMRVRRSAIEIRWKHAAAGLRSRDGAPLTHFLIAGADRTFLAARASIHGDTIVVSHPEVPDPVAVRFGWHETAMPNLVNAAGLPARPFRTDDWPVAVEAEHGTADQR